MADLSLPRTNYVTHPGRLGDTHSVSMAHTHRIHARYLPQSPILSTHAEPHFQRQPCHVTR